MIKSWNVFICSLWCCTAGNFRLSVQMKRWRKLTAQRFDFTLQRLTKLTSQHGLAVCCRFLVGWLNLLLMWLCGDKCLKIDFITLVQCGRLMLHLVTSCSTGTLDPKTPKASSKDVLQRIFTVPAFALRSVLNREVQTLLGCTALLYFWKSSMASPSLFSAS